LWYEKGHHPPVIPGCLQAGEAKDFIIYDYRDRSERVRAGKSDWVKKFPEQVPAKNKRKGLGL